MRWSTDRRWKPRWSKSRVASSPEVSDCEGSTRKTAMVAAWRRPRLNSSFTWLMRRRRSQGSKRSGSRRLGRSRQQATSVSWTASSARSASRRMRRATAKSRSTTLDMMMSNASRSPWAARSTSARSIAIPSLGRDRRGRAHTLLSPGGTERFNGHRAAPAGQACRRRRGSGYGLTDGDGCEAGSSIWMESRAAWIAARSGSVVPGNSRATITSR